MAGYNLTRFAEDLLETNKTSPPSFSVHLYPEHWTLNGGSKFLYNNQVACLLDDIRAQRIPNDFLELFDSAKVPFYDGCMIVELLDYRPPKGKDPALVLENPEKTRVVLCPNSETLWANLCLLNQKTGNVWTDEDAVEVESRILSSTAPPLCLDPDPHLTRIVNNILRVSAPPTPASLKRKAAAMEMEEDEIERTRRAKIMHYMNPKPHRSTVPSYRILEVIQRMKVQKAQAPPPAPSTLSPSAAPVPTPAATPIPAPSAPAPAPTPVPYTANMTTSSARRGTTPAPTPTPPPLRPPSVVSETKKKTKASESPLMRPPSAIPPAIPPHMQPHYPNTIGRSSPVSSQAAHTPRPPSTAGSVGSPASVEKRPLSAAQIQQPTQPVQQPPQRIQPSPAQQPQPQPVAPQIHPQQPPATFQPAIPAPNFLAQTPVSKKKLPSQLPAQPSSQVQYMTQYQAYQQQQVLRMNQQQNQNASPAPLNAAQAAAAAAQRNSPMITTQPLVSRSPMPQQQPPQQMAHPPQQSYNYTAMHNQYGTQMRPAVPHGHVPHTQLMQHHAAAAAGQNGQVAQDQQAHHTAPMMAQYQAAHMFNMNYSQMGMNMGVQQARMPQAYWPVGMGRGMPLANGQHQMPGMAGHPQQLGAAGKAGGMQGS